MCPRSCMPAIVAMLSLAGAPSGIGQPTKATTRTFTLLGTVQPPLDHLPAETHAVRITGDARILIRIRIDKILVGTAPWKQGQTMAFLIHSPSLMFGPRDVSGQQFRFTFSAEEGPVPEGGCRYCLTALADTDKARK